MRFHQRLPLLVLISITTLMAFAQAPQKPRITLEEFFNFVSIGAVKISPDGHTVLIETRRADWDRERFRRDIWLYREGMTGPVLLTQSGHDDSPEWSPDGRWIAFKSDRPAPAGKSSETAAKTASQLYLISPSGGEAFAVTRGEESVGEFAWSPDSATLFFSTRTPLSKPARDQIKQDWKDVQRFRESERGDVIARINVADVVARSLAGETSATANKDADRKTASEPGETAESPGSQVVATTPYSVGEIVPSPDGSLLAFTTEPPSHRIEDPGVYEIFVVSATGGQPRQLTRNRVLESGLRWSNDARQLFFHVRSDIDAGYEQIQGRVYCLDLATKAVRRCAPDFAGSISSHEIAADGTLVGLGTIGTQVQVFAQRMPDGHATTVNGWPGTYGQFSLARHSSRVAFLYSSLQRPAEVYIADGLDQLRTARPVTQFNRLFTERALPQGMPYRWKSDDGAEVEGMLIYPPGKFGAKHLRMLTLIHGGPAAADGDRFRADWYEWGILAASNDWLVFRPNYRGSTGYGDKFQRDISPQIVSRPGKDILAGIDALVRDGIADPDQLTIGGYSYGGYMTNWLITQTTRFKAAVSGAGAIEHAANWGNDDLTFDDAWYLGGAPWEAEKTYNDEAALWQINKVKTPTHIVAGGSDIRVAVAEGYLLERALHTLNVHSTLLIFPGEGHSLANNPWHGRIKVREELQWLEKYCAPAAPTPAAR